MSHFSSEDLIFHKVNNKIVSAGFGINSILMNKGLAPILSFTNDYDNSDSSDSDTSSSSSDSDSETSKKPKKQVFKSFKNLAIPIHLFSMHEPSKMSKKQDDEYMEDHGHLPDNIYDELIKLVDFDKKQKRKSKKNYKNNSNKSNKTNKSKKTKTYKNNK